MIKKDSLGQLIMTGIEGTFLTKEEESFIRHNKIGGVLLFSKNFEAPAQLAELCNTIQSLSEGEKLLIAVDQEGGRVQRFKAPFIQIPSAEKLTKLNSPQKIYQLSYYIGQELASCGVNTNFAPVVDVLTNSKNKVIGDRSFGSCPEIVSTGLSAFIRGHKKAGVFTCAKHFPGHGMTTKDSHLDLPIVKDELEELQKTHFPPFKKAFRNNVEIMMMAHLLVDVIDQQFPCSLSRNAYQLIRREINFKGVIVSDDMQMKAIEDHFSLEEAARMAIEAGCNLLEYRDMEFAAKALESLRKKPPSEDKITSSIELLKELKSRIHINYPVRITDIPKVFNNQEKMNFLSQEIDEE